MIDKFTNELLHKIVNAVKKEKNQELLKIHVVDPAICYIFDRVYPYIFISSVIFILILLLAIIILFILIKTLQNK